MKLQPIKVMKSIEEDQYNKKHQRVSKIEARFEDVSSKVVLKAMEGLDELKPMTKMDDMSYSHMAMWGHRSAVIQFRCALYRYKDRSCLFIFTPILEPYVSPEEAKRRACEARTKLLSIKAEEAKIEAMPVRTRLKYLEAQKGRSPK
jgi:hypothetical protein